MKKESLFIEMPEAERAEALAAMSFATETEKVRREFSDYQKTDLKDFVVKESTTAMDLNKEFKSIKKEFDTALKTHKEGILDALTTLKRGYTENEERVFLIDDQEEGVMNVYDNKGEYLYTRKLRPEEKQARILSAVS